MSPVLSTTRYFSHIPSSSLLTWQNSVLFALLLKLQYVFYDIPDPWNPNQQLNVFMKIFHTSMTSFAKYWNGFEIHDIDKIQQFPGGSLLVGYHSRPTLDLVYLLATLKPKIVVTHLFFRVPLMQGILDMMGLIPSKSVGHRSPEESFVDAITTPGRPTVLLPGGIHDAMKPYDQKYTVNWNNPPGFARVMAKHKDLLHQRHGVQVIPFYTRNSELAFYHIPILHDYFGNMGMNMYNSFNKGNLILLPFLLTTFLLAFGFLLLPKRVKLVTYLGDPLMMEDNESAEDFGKRVSKSVQELVNEVNKLDVKKNGEKSILYKEDHGGVFDDFNTVVMGTYTLVQNAMFIGSILVMIWSMFPPLILYSIFKLCVKGSGKNKTIDVNKSEQASTDKKEK